MPEANTQAGRAVLKETQVCARQAIDAEKEDPDSGPDGAVGVLEGVVGLEVFW